VARTIADLDGSPDIEIGHLSEAINFRNLDRDNWGRRWLYVCFVVSPLKGLWSPPVCDVSTELLSLSGHFVGRIERRKMGRLRMVLVRAKALQKGE